MASRIQAGLPEGVVWPFFWGKGVEMKRTLIVFFTVLLFSATAVYAELHDRGGGLIYDDVLDVTWLQDANYAYTSGYDDDGLMTWHEAMEWADQLEYGGLTDWRLASAFNAGGELAYLFNIYGVSLSNPSPFINLNTYDSSKASGIWLLETDGGVQAWDLSFINGNQYLTPVNAELYAWAVRDGDVAPRVEYSLTLQRNLS